MNAFPEIHIRQTPTAGVSERVYCNGMTYRQYVAAQVFSAMHANPKFAGLENSEWGHVLPRAVIAWEQADALIAAEKEG